MTHLLERVIHLAANGVDIETMTMVFRSEGYHDEEISEAYTTVGGFSTTEAIRGQYYLRLL